MTDTNPNGVYTKEVTLCDEDGDQHTDANPVPVKTISSVLSTVLASILAAIIAMAGTIGFILSDIQGKADLVENQPVTIYDSTNTIPADVINYEGSNSIAVIIEYQSTFTINISLNNQSGTVGYMLIDLSDTTNWPHTNTGHIVLKQISINSNTNAAFVGDLLFGFLSNVDDTNGDFHQVWTLHGERSSNVGSGVLDFSNFGIGLESDEWFGPTGLNDTTWQTDVNLIGPTGAASFPSGAGDFVMKLVSTAGAADISVTVIYTTAE